MAGKSDKELIYLPGGNGAATAEEQELLPALDEMTPREIVAELDEVADRAEQTAEERVLDLLLPPSPPPSPGTSEADAAAQREQSQRTREKLRAQLREGKLDQRMVDIEVRERGMPAFEIISNQGVDEMDVNIKDMLTGMFGQQKKKRKMSA